MTRRILAFLAVLALLLVLPAVGRTALAQQPPPHRFGGTATLDGKAVGAGVKVSAEIDRKEVATATTTAGGNYIIDVLQSPGASHAGKTVTFHIGAAKVTQSATWALGGATVLNLAGASGPPAPTPQSTPTPAPVTAPTGPKQGLFGVVTAVTKDTVTLEKNGETVTLKVDAKSQVGVPGVAAAMVTDISVGSRVALLVEPRVDGLYIVRIMVMAAQANEKHITLTVLEVSGKTVIAVTSTGKQIVVEFESELPGELKGQRITFIGEQPESNRFKAKAAMKLENVIARLEKHVKEKKVEAEGERDVRAKAQREQNVEALKARLEANLGKHLDHFAEVIANAPEHTRPALERALQNFKKDAEAALRSVERSPQDVQRVVERRTVEGTVESINSTTTEITVRSRGHAAIKVKVEATTEIRIGEAAGTFADIRVGDPLQVHFNRETGEALRVRIKPEVEAKGRIKTIDATAKTLVLELPGNATLTLKLTERTRIEVNNRFAAVANLPVGMVVAVKYNSRSLELVGVAGELRAQFELTVDRIAAQARTIVGHTDDGKSVTVKVTDRTHVEARGGLSSIFGLHVGARIEVESNPLNGETFKIKVLDKERVREEAKARGTVTKVDSAAKKLTLRLPDKSEITVTITNATELEVDGRDAALADLKEGNPVMLTYRRVHLQQGAVPEILVALEVEAITRGKEQPRPEPRRGERATVEGIITAVDPSKRTLTIFTKHGETRVITIPPDIAMAFNENRIAALSQLPLAAAVKVEVTEENVAIRIETRKKEEKIEETAADAKRKEQAAAEAKRREEAAAEAKRREEAAAEAKRREEAAAEAR